MLATAYNGTVKQATRNVQIVLQNLLHNELNSDVQSALSLSLWLRMKTGLNLLLASLSVLWKIIDKDANASEVFPYFAPYQEIRILESEEVLLVESGILGFAIRSTALGIRNPLNLLLGL